MSMKVLTLSIREGFLEEVKFFVLVTLHDIWDLSSPTRD